MSQETSNFVLGALLLIVVIPVLYMVARIISMIGDMWGAHLLAPLAAAIGGIIDWKGTVAKTINQVNSASFNDLHLSSRLSHEARIITIQVAALRTSNHFIMCALVLSPAGFLARDLQEMMQERGLQVDHSTIWR